MTTTLARPSGGRLLVDGEEYTFWANYTSERYLGEWKQRLERGGYAVHVRKQFYRSGRFRDWSLWIRKVV